MSWKSFSSANRVNLNDNNGNLRTIWHFATVLRAFSSKFNETIFGDRQKRVLW